MWAGKRVTLRTVLGAASLVAMTGFVSPVKAAGGAYLVDDASITPAGHCQLESWIQALSGGQSLLATNPACSTGPVECTLGVAAQGHPFQHQEAPAVKWMLRDPDKHSGIWPCRRTSRIPIVTS